MASAKEALNGLMVEWQNYVEPKRNAGFLDFLFVPKKLEDELSNSVSRNITQLYEDWEFISYFMVDQLEVYSTSSDPVIQTVHNLSKEIGRVIKDCDYGKKHFKRKPRKLLSLLSEFRQKTVDILNPQTGEALGSFVQAKFGCDLVGSLISLHGDVWAYMEEIKCAHVNLGILTNKLALIQRYFLQRTSILFSSSGDGETHALFTYMSSVIGNIASHSFDVWINKHDIEIVKVKAAKLVDLGCQIDPINPEFVKLLLGFLVDVHAKNSYRYHVESFSDYLLTDSLKYFHKYGDIRDEVRSLVDIYVISRLKGYSSLEEFSCLLEETESVLRDISSIYLSVDENKKTDHDHLCGKLAGKVRLLRVELFIRDHLHSRDISWMHMDKLRMFVEGLRIRTSGYSKQCGLLIEEMNGILEPLLKFSTIREIRVDNLLQQVLFKIIFFKAQASLFKMLIKIQRHAMDPTLVNKDQISSLLEELVDFKRLFATKLIWTLPDVHNTVAELAKMIALIPEDSMAMSVSLDQVWEKVKCIKAMLQQISAPPSALSNVPKICILGFIKFLSRNINDLLNYDPPSIAPMKYQLEEGQQQLESLGSLVVQLEDEDLNDHITQTVHKLEYVVESIEFDSDSKYLFWLYNLVQDIGNINRRVAKKSNVVSTKIPSSGSKEETGRSELNEVMVDLADEENAIVDELMRGSLNRDVVSIAGMPGLGKTTLARKVYTDKRVMYHFPRRAWCNVSQVYSERELLIDILRCIYGVTDEIQKMSDNELQSKTRRCLLGNRYLIILDDVWDIGAWSYLQICFPDDKNGSRVLITSRRQDLQSAIKPGSDPYLLRLFACEESWVLLEKKIFGEGVGCPEELLLLGKKIAEQCQGLPLAIVAIAGLLRKSEKTQGWWQNICESLYTQVINDPETRCKEILELSYRHLPEDLKACFLYLGAFSGDRDVPKAKLIHLWIAEGFIHESESRSLEEVAHDYLMELINTSMVFISDRGSNGEVKACRLHDLLRDLCLSKAKEENFLNLVTGHDEPYSSFPAYEYDMEFQNKRRVHPVTFESYRLSIHLRRNHFVDSRPSGPRTRSLIFFASPDKEPRRPYDVSFIGEKFSLLRVLDLECINIGVSFPDELGLMMQLRYLSVSGYLRSIPASISKLWKLQFLVVKGLQGTVILPATLWSMENLRYLHVSEHVSFDWEGIAEQAGRLDKLVSFSTPSLSFGDDTVEMLRKRLPNIVRLRCIFSESEDCSGFPALDFLTRLVSLKIVYYGGGAGEFILPSSLRKLTLSGFRLPWSHVSSIGRLPNLRVLKLVSGAFEGPRWEMSEEEFRELEFLKLEALDIAEWDATYDHLPNLKRLVLRNCYDLEEIPQDFAGIPTLETIQVQWCKQTVADSAERIGNETKEIKVIISYN